MRAFHLVSIIVFIISLMASTAIAAFVVVAPTRDCNGRTSPCMKNTHGCDTHRCGLGRHATNNNNDDDDDDGGIPRPTRSAEESSCSSSSRRHFLATSSSSSVFAAVSLPFGMITSLPSLASAQDDTDDSTSSLSLPSPTKQKRTKPKILILGGTGFVGSRVVQLLSNMDIETIATSRNGRNGTIALDFAVPENKDTTIAITQEQQAMLLQRLSSGCTAVISCVGAIGTKNDMAVNAATGIAAQAAKAAGVQRFVYITVDPQVQEFAREVDVLQEYMEGKASSRKAVLEAFANEAILIEPTFIYGGGSFELNPPRVMSFYGKLIEGILSSSPIRNVERLLSPGIVKIALEPPVPVQDVANAAVAGALGETTLSILDSYDKIKLASAQLQ